MEEMVYRKIPIEEVLEHVTYQGHQRPKYRVYRALRVLMNTRKLRVFAQKGTACAFCKIKGEYFRVHYSCPGRGFLQLYATRNGSEVMMTVDHITPRAKGGRNALENLQTMCTDCNNAKGALTGKKTQKWKDKVIRKILGIEKPKRRKKPTSLALMLKADEEANTVAGVATDWDKWVAKMKEGEKTSER